MVLQVRSANPERRSFGLWPYAISAPFAVPLSPLIGHICGHILQQPTVRYLILRRSLDGYCGAVMLRAPSATLGITILVPIHDSFRNISASIRNKDVLI